MRPSAALTIRAAAEAIALSFIAPLVALYLAALVLGESIRGRAVGASLMGLAGVAVIVLGRAGSPSAAAGHEEALWGTASILLGACANESIRTGKAIECDDLVPLP